MLGENRWTVASERKKTTMTTKTALSRTRDAGRPGMKRRTMKIAAGSTVGGERLWRSVLADNNFIHAASASKSEAGWASARFVYDIIDFRNGFATPAPNSIQHSVHKAYEMCQRTATSVVVKQKRQKLARLTILTEHRDFDFVRGYRG